MEMGKDSELLIPIKLYSKYARETIADKMYDLFSEKSSVKKVYTKEEYIRYLQPELDEASWFAEYPSKFRILSKRINKKEGLALLKVEYKFEKKLPLQYEYFILSYEENEWKIVEKSEAPLKLNKTNIDITKPRIEDTISVENGIDFLNPEKEVFIITIKGNWGRVNIIGLLLNTDEKKIIDVFYKPNLILQEKKEIPNHFRGIEFEDSYLEILKDTLKGFKELTTENKIVNEFLKQVINMK